MNWKQAAAAAGLVATLAAAPLSGAKAQYCSPFPLAWPFCAARAVVGTAAVVATAPFRAVAGPPYYYPPRPYYRPYYGYYYRPRYYGYAGEPAYAPGQNN